MSGAGEAPSGPEDIEATAAEYVVGVLDVSETRAVRVRARSEPALAAAIVAWEIRLAPLAAAIPPVAPPTALWQRIEARIAAVPEEPANDAEPGAQPTAVTPAPRPRGLRAWQAATVLALAAAAVFAGIAFLPSAPPGGPPLAVIAPIGAPQTAFVAQARPDGTVVLTAVMPAEVPPGRDLELWILPPGAKTVAPLGVLPATGRTLRLPTVPAAGTQLLISLEPRGGSPTGQPTGPVLYKGTLTGA